ncbi:MAG: biosynthetic-type acetolactate synthase large subunit [Oscillospiraceae bacterium]
MKLNGSEILTEVLIEQGVTTIFGYPGGSVLNIYDALYKYSDKITHIMTAHEQGAAHAADGWARITGETGVCLATSGPGATNLVTGIATAYMDSVPMVCITGNVPQSLIGRDSFQEVYITGITMPITKHNFVVRNVEELASIIRDAFRIANTGRKGPVLVDIPKDITAAVCDFDLHKKIEVSHDDYLDTATLEKVATLINKANRPVLMFGGGVVSSEAEGEIRAFCEKTDMPACHTMMATGVLGFGEKQDIGLVGMHGCITANRAVAKCDLLVAMGARFSDRVALNPDCFAPDAKVIHIDIDASEANKNIRCDIGVIGDIKKVLTHLIPMLEKTTHPDWMQKISDWKDCDYRPIDNDEILMPHQMMKTICDKAGEDVIIVTDVGQHQMWAAQYCKRIKEKSFLTSGGLGTMGYGYGAAIGAKMACPTRPVIHITGDGSFHMNLNECCTAVSYDLPIITVIMNNTVLGMVRQWQHTFYGDRYSATDPHRKTDFVKLAEGFGATGYRCENLAQFNEVFAKALTSKTPVWIDCKIDKDEKVLPMIPGGQTVENTIRG